MLRLFSADPDHPLADPKEVRRILAQVAAEDADRCLREVAEWLEALAADGTIKPEQRFSVLSQFDAVVQPHLRTRARDYLVGSGLTREQRDADWLATRNLWSGLASGYAACLDEGQRGQRKDFLKRDLPLLSVLLLRAHGQWQKWDMFRYGPHLPDLWRSMGQAYLAAVDAGTEQRRCAPFPGAPETSAHDEYLRALVVKASSMDRLRPLDIEIAERLIGALLPRFSLSCEAGQDSGHWVNPAEAVGPVRLVRRPQRAPGLRFFGTAGAIADLDALIDEARDGHLPPQLDLGAQYPPKMVLPVLRHLRRYWSTQAPLRAHARHAVRSTLQSISGLASVFGQLQKGDGKPVQWEIEDVSRGGFCIRAVSRDASAVRLGMLIGLQPAGGENWLVGIVRRLTREGDSQYRLGVETLSHAPVALQADLSGERVPVVLLDPLEVGAEARLVLPRFGYEECGVITLQHEGRFAELEPKGLIESAEDCDLARYRVSQILVPH